MSDFQHGDLIARQGIDVRDVARFIAWHPDSDPGMRLVRTDGNEVGTDWRADEYVKLTDADQANVSKIVVVLMRQRAHVLKTDDAWQMAWELHQAGYRKPEESPE